MHTANEPPLPEIRSGAEKYHLMKLLGERGMGRAHVVIDRDLKWLVALMMIGSGADRSLPLGCDETAGSGHAGSNRRSRESPIRSGHGTGNPSRLYSRNGTSCRKGPRPGDEEAMRQIVIDLDEATLERLERVAPTRQRKRTEFIRAAIRRALDELAQEQIAGGYRRLPDDADPRYFVAEQWEPDRPRRRKTRR